MDATYYAGENTYLKIQILSVEEQPNEVRYEAKSSSGDTKFFLRQTRETMKRSPEDVDNTEGEKIMRDILNNISKNMTDSDYLEAFNVKSLADLLDSDLTETEIISAYNTWYARNNITVNSVVDYTPFGQSESMRCVVINIEKGETNQDNKEENTNTYKLYHHDEVNDKHEFFDATRTEIINLGVRVNVDYYLDQLGDAISSAK